MKYIVAISDTHIGGFEGLCPEKGIHLEGGTYKPDKFQKYIWRCWRHFWDEFVPHVTAGDEENVVVVHNGDVVDGNHHHAVNLIPNVQSQEAAAAQILEPVRKKYPVYMVRGTESHGDKSDMSTERVARTLEGVADGTATPISYWQLWLDLNGCLFQFAHHIGGTSSAAYETSAPMRELVAGLVESAQWKQRMPDVFVRSHRHRFLPISIPSADGRIQLVVTPGWQLRTPYVEKIDRMRLPHIGGVIFKVDEEGRCQVIEKIYKMPRQPVIQI